MTPTICIYAIMRDESANVLDWLAEIDDVDHIVVVDTGSDDDTAELLRGGGATVFDARIEPFRFDVARNMALALCPPTVDLCLRLDADERLSVGWRNRLDDVYGPFARYRYPVINHGVGWGQIMRDDCHQRHGFWWRYPTHEILVGPGSVCDVPGMHIDHHPPTERRPHHYSNVIVLADAVAENLADHRLAFYFARELFYVGEWIRSRAEMMRFLRLPDGWGPERAEAYRILATMDDYPERWLWHAVGESPERREPYCDLARLFVKRGQWLEAEAMLTIADHREDDTIYTTDAACWGDAYTQLQMAVAARVPEATP